MLPRLSRAKAKPVTKWSEVRDDAKAMLKMVDGTFPGIYPKAFALHHAQVRAEPRSFFVLSSAAAARFGLAFRIILNPRVIDAPRHVKDEKTGRTAPNFAMMSEACVSFPHRKSRNVGRYGRMTVEFQTSGAFGLKTHLTTLDGLASQVFQHEVDHGKGINVFGLYAEDLTTV